MSEHDVKARLAELRAAADRVQGGFPETTWQCTSAGKESELTLTRGASFKGLAIEAGQAMSLRCHLKLPARSEGIAFVGEPLEATLFSLYPIRIDWNGRTVFEEGGVPVAAGPPLFTLIPKLVEGDNGTLTLDVHVPAHQVTNWLKFRITTPSFRLQFEQLDTLWAQLSLADELCPAEHRPLLNRAAALVPGVIASIGNPELLEKKCLEVVEILAPIRRSISIPPVHLIGHCHIDMNWLWTWPDTVEVIKRDFRSVLKLMEDYPELTFSHSQPATYEVIRQEEPELFKKVLEHIRTGRWEATTLQWIECDANMPSGEAHARQLLEGATYSKEFLGEMSSVLHAPDTFGHAGNLPQLFASAGATDYYHHRCNPGGAKQWPAYWWEGIDGTRLLAFSTPSYNGEITAGDLARAALRAITASLPCGIHFHGIGDHGGGPARQSLDTFRRIKDLTLLPKSTCSTLSAYARSIKAAAKNLPVFRGEMNSIFEGCYTTHADTKRYNRAGENLLTTADTLAAIAGKTSDAPTVDAWRKLLFNQFHDILDGSAIHESYEGHAADFEAVCNVAHEVTENALRVLQANVPNGSIAVTNPLGVDREDWVCVPGDWSSENCLLQSTDGQTIPAQRTPKGLGFVARVKAFETVAYQFLDKETASDHTTLSISPAYAPADNRSDNFLGDAATEAPYYLIHTKFFRVYLRRNCGVFVSFFDKRVSKELVGYGLRRGSDYIDTARPDLALNVLQLLDERPQGMTAWQMHEVVSERSLLSGGKASIVESGPLRCTIRVEHSEGKSTIQQDVIFYRDLPRVDFETHVDWQELGTKETGVPSLKVAFNARLDDCEAWYEVPFGAAKRPADGQENVALRWADVGGAEYGIALLNDSKYGYDILGTRLRMTLLRSAYDPDAISDVGQHTIRYSFFPHPRDWRSADVVTAAAGFNQPLLARVPQNDSPKTNRDALFSPRITGDNGIIIAAIKPGRNGGRIIRLYDSTGQGGTISLTGLGAASQIDEVNVIESSIAALDHAHGTLQLQFRPWQVRSIRVR